MLRFLSGFHAICESYSLLLSPTRPDNEDITHAQKRVYSSGLPPSPTHRPYPSAFGEFLLQISVSLYVALHNRYSLKFVQKKPIYTQHLIDAHIIQTRDAVDPMINNFHLFIYAALRHPPIPLIEGLHSVPSPMSKWLSGRRAAREQRRGSSSVPPSHP